MEDLISTNDTSNLSSKQGTPLQNIPHTSSSTQNETLSPSIHNRQPILSAQNQTIPTSLEKSDKDLNLTQKQKTAELKTLIHEEKFRKLKKKPWEINVVKTISDFQKRVFDNPDIKFRIGGRVIYSTSRLVSEKSNLIIQASQETQDEIENAEEEEMENQMESMDDLLGDYDAILPVNSSDLEQLASEQMKDYIQHRNLELEQNIYMKPFYSEDRTGQRFLSSPIRKIYRKIDFGDLGRALSKSLNYQLRRTTRSRQKPKVPEIDTTEIIPENVLKKTEEDRALVEMQINKIYKKVQNFYLKAHEPIAFLELIISPDPDGIVRTLLYLLQLVNRKKIQLWQKMDDLQPDEKIEAEEKEEAPLQYVGDGLDIFITPLK